MRKLVLCLAATAAALAAAEDKETIRQTYPSASKVEIRNLNGGVRITGYEGNDIQFVAHKHIEAKTAEALEQARREVRLDIRSGGGVFRACVEGPFSQCDGDRGRGCRGDCDRDYTVRYDFELQVPRAAALDLKTVNGRVDARGVNGDFEAKSVNGAVTLEDMGGSGNATTVNGGVKLSFRESPRQPLTAKTVNGAIEAAFPKNLNGVLRFRTLHGDVFTNFPTTALANEPPVAERSGGRTRIRANQRFSVRAGASGPEHQFETVNGSIQIRERE